MTGFVWDLHPSPHHLSPGSFWDNPLAQSASYEGPGPAPVWLAVSPSANPITPHPSPCFMACHRTWDKVQNPYRSPICVFQLAFLPPIQPSNLTPSVTLAWFCVSNRSLASCHQTSPPQRGPPNRSTACCLPAPLLQALLWSLLWAAQRACVCSDSIRSSAACLPILTTQSVSLVRSSALEKRLSAVLLPLAPSALELCLSWSVQMKLNL